MTHLVPVEVTVPVTLDNHATVLIGGHPVTDAVHAVEIDIRHGCVNRVHLSLAAAEVRFAGRAEVTIPEPTRTILLALGWTPPGDDA